jgi:cystathionine beta-lyase/cystathionine gamma-synthase
VSDSRAADQGFGTRAIRAATRAPRLDQTPDVVPIYQAVTFSAEDAAELGDVLGDKVPGFAYSRLDNPTVAALADAMAEVEGAEAGYGFATGMAAISGMFTALLRSGDHVVAASALYGSVGHLLERILARFGVDTTFADATDPDAVEAAFRPNTRLLHLETIANPTLAVADIADLAERAHRHGATVSVDNTFASPYICRPIELGADLVAESLTKWIGGHSDVLGGVVVGSKERIAAIREVQVDTGATLAPLNAFLALRGLATLHVRMERHVASAHALARHLQQSEAVRSTFYPGLPSHPQFGVAQRQLRAGGGLLALDLGDRQTAERLLDALTIPPMTASLGSVRSMAVHPPSTTHRQLDAAALERAGIREGLIRVSVGLEDVDDLIADFDQALARAAQATSAAQV